MRKPLVHIAGEIREMQAGDYVPSFFVGEIRTVAFATAPEGWALCDGQTLQVADEPALFAVIGYTYGGDGMTNFKVPDLRGRVPVGAGDGAGLTSIAVGASGGANGVTVNGEGTAEINLIEANLPPHSHDATLDLSGVAPVIQVSTDYLTSQQPMAVGASLCQTGGGPGQGNIFTVTPSGTIPLSGTSLGGTGTVTVDNTGSGETLEAPVSTTADVSVMQPYLGVNYIIALAGIAP
ncbi:MAG: phage tail protein [Ramlibacter sp.]